MGEASGSATARFRDLERAGWTARASAYDAFIGAVTVGAVDALLEATGTGPGSDLLDVACGPGYGAGIAARRGATATGIDFAPTMVAEAQRRYPGVEFRDGDAERLDFPDASFDAVICAFELLHLAEPDRAVAEAYRVLRPGGRFAFTVWAPPERHDFFRLVLGAIQAHGKLDVDLPPAPPLFRFSDPEECQRTLSAAGFVEVDIREVPLHWHTVSPDAVIDMLEKSTVRSAMLFERQDPAAAERIRRSIIEATGRFACAGGYELAFPAVLAAARRP